MFDIKVLLDFPTWPKLNLGNLGVEQVRAASQKYVVPDAMFVLAVGDRA